MTTATPTRPRATPSAPRVSFASSAAEPIKLDDSGVAELARAVYDKVVERAKDYIDDKGTVLLAAIGDMIREEVSKQLAPVQKSFDIIHKALKPRRTTKSITYDEGGRPAIISEVEDMAPTTKTT